MTTTSFELQPLQPEDAPRCTDIYFAAFQNAHSLGCWPRGVPTIRAFWENMIVKELTDAGAHWFKVVERGSAATATNIVGFAKWQEPNPGHFPDTDLPEWPAEADTKLCDETFGAWAAKHRELMQDRGHWYLEIVAVDPAYQGKGAGGMILRWGTERADRDGSETYLEASPEAVPLYHKFGFREADRVDTFIDNERVKATWYRNLYMIRPAKK